MCCSGLLKIIMFTFNGIIFLAGATVLGVGIWVVVDSSSMFGVLSHIDNIPSGFGLLANLGYLLITVGAILTFMGFLGCYGAVTENKCMLMTFCCILFMIFLTMVSGAIVILVFKPLVMSLLNNLNEKFVEKIKKDYGKDDDFTSFLNKTMEQLKCCGFNNYTDFTLSPFETVNKHYPGSCCVNDTTLCDLSTAQNEIVKGCFIIVYQLIENKATLLGGLAVLTAVLEITAMVVSLHLFTVYRVKDRIEFD